VAADANVPEASKALNEAFVASARGDWPTVGEILRRLVEEDDANYAVRAGVPFPYHFRFMPEDLSLL
jgi:hypothetical protein